MANTSPANPNPPPNPPPFYPAAEAESDPWRMVDSEAGAEANSWLLSYLDVMTLLFAFVTALFAYQKALSLHPVASAQRPAVQVEKKLAAAPKPIPVSLPAKAAEPAVAAMPQSKAPEPAPSTATPPAPPALADAAPSAGASQAVAPPIPMPSAPLPPVPEAENAVLSVAPLAGGFGGAVEIAETAGKLRLEISDAILFDPARAEIKAEGATVLERVAYWLRTQEGTIAVEGHTDNRPISGGRYGSNWELSTARASTVTRYLIEHGVAAERLRAVGLADIQPRAGNDTPEGRARNRRVTLVVYVVKDEGVKI